ncbi:uncharacterized protein LOC130696253 [Daphnia carinata]|uniref:uncharacterized protein LOC130696253 n=1 Tax=Daphnia carinata TaxID=120202 RepID=UPI00257BD2E1|nr:uncharacterized protein LOC130696253 [Daphnia carinata]
MVVTCYVEGCNSGYESYEKIYFFKPKDEKVLIEWQKLIGKQNVKLKKNHSVCHKHFEDADIIKQKIFDGKDGPIVVYDLRRWKLIDGALPKLHTGKPVQNRLSVPNVGELSVLCEIANAVQPGYHTLTTHRIPEQHIINPKEIYLPVSWFWQEGSPVEEEFICSRFKWLNENKFEYTKTIIIHQNSKTIRYFVRGQQVFHENFNSQFESLEDLTACVKTFDNAQNNVNSNFSITTSDTIPKSICAAIDRQDVVQFVVEKNIQKRPSYPSKKTDGNARHQSSVKFKLPIQHSNRNVSEDDGDPKFTSMFTDHTYGVGTDKPITPVKLACETLCERNSSVADTKIPNDDWTIRPADDRAAFTLQYPHEFFSTSVSKSKELERRLVKHPISCEYKNSAYSLVSYHLETWCLGVYSPFKLDDITSTGIVKHKIRPKVIGKTIAKDGIDLHQPSFLVAQPVHFYRRSKALCPSVSKQTRKSAPELVQIENMKPHKGKIHVTLNGEPPAQLSLSDLFCEDSNSCEHFRHEGPNVRKNLFFSEICANSLSANTEKDKDESDLKLAKILLEKEAYRKKMLQKKFRRFSVKLYKSKNMARSILMAAKEFEVKRREFGISNKTKRPSIAKKAGPQTQCNQCGKMILVARMKFHLKVHSGVKSHLCELCGRAFALRNSLNSHIRFHHRGQARPKHFMCSTCGYTCRSKNHLEKHERIHTNERPFDCKYCDKKFREKGTLVRHIRTHTGEKPYACNICGTSYAARQTYVSHYRRKHEKREPGNERLPRRANGPTYSCEFCQKTFYRLLTYERHRSTHTGVAAAIRCRVSGCIFTYSDLGQLKNHMLAEHPEKAYVCKVCKKIFLTKLNLTLHQSVHDPSRGFQCSFCPTRLTAKESLVAHEKLHTRETPHECSFCEMRFHSTYLLQIHVRTHQPNHLKRKRRRKNPVDK